MLTSRNISVNEDVKLHYDLLKIRFNTIAEQNRLKQETAAYIKAKEGQSFREQVLFEQHAIVDIFTIVPIVNPDIAHRILDEKSTKEKKVLEHHQAIVSARLIDTLKALETPENYTQAVAMLTLVLEINPNYLDSTHREEFMAFRSSAELKMHLFGHERLDNSYYQSQLKQRQDQMLDKMHVIETQQKNLGQIVTQGHADIKVLLEQLRAQGIEITDQLINGLMQNQLIQEDVRSIVSYLENAAIEKIRQQQHEMKMANYQGLQDACYFVGQLGNLVGSKDLVRMTQITQEGIKIHQAVDQILSPSIVSAAILSPYAAIGMAALRICSLFQKSNHLQAMILKQLANISRQIKSLHQEVLQQFGRVDEKLNYILFKILESFENLDLSLHVNVEYKLAQIQSEIVTLTTITKTGFETLLTKDLAQYIQHIEDVKQGVVSPNLTQMEFEIRMGTLARFIKETSALPIFNGMVYQHLLESDSGSTRQLIDILSQQSVSILHGILSIVVKHAKHKLAIDKLQSIAPENIVHPGLWQVALEAYSDMQMMYADKYCYDPEGKHIAQFKQQANQLSVIVSIFSSSFAFYQALLTQIKANYDLVTAAIAAVPLSHQPPLSGSRILCDIPEKLDNKVKQAHINFFELNNLLKLLLVRNKVVPDVFFKAEQLGIGYLEFKVHLPISVRSRKHHSGFGINKGELTGLEITFVTGTERISIFSPHLSNEYNHKKLQVFYCHILSVHTKRSYTDASIEYMNHVIKEFTNNQKKQKALRIASTFQNTPAYHELLKLSHLLLISLIYGGFSVKTIQSVRQHLFLDDVSVQFARLAKSNADVAEFPLIGQINDAVITKICDLIFSEIEQSKASGLATQVNKGKFIINKLEILSKSALLQPKKIEVNDSTDDYGKFFKNTPNESCSKPNSSVVKRLEI